MHRTVDSLKDMAIPPAELSIVIPTFWLFDVPSPYIGELAYGNAPSWMKVVYRSNELLIYSPNLRP